jgi:hypothetical protein
MNHRYLLLPALLVGGCATIPDVPKNNIVMVDGTGTLVDPGPNIGSRHTSFLYHRSIDDPSVRQARYKEVVDELRPPTGMCGS